MPRSFKCVLGPAFALATLASAQTPLPTPTAAPAAAVTHSQPTTTIRTGAKLVVVDVTVSDKNGNPLHDLKRADFTVLENSGPQTINAFEEHLALAASDAVKFPPLPPMPPGVFTNITPAPINSAVNIILIDSLNTPSADQAYMRSQMVNYIGHAPLGTSIAIFTLTTQLTMLHGFTSDLEILRRLVSKQLGQASPLIARTQTGEDSSDIVAAYGGGAAAATVAAFQTLTSAQTPQPSQPAATQQPPQSGVATLRAGTQLVVVDCSFDRYLASSSALFVVNAGPPRTIEELKAGA